MLYHIIDYFQRTLRNFNKIISNFAKHEFLVENTFSNREFANTSIIDHTLQVLLNEHQKVEVNKNYMPRCSILYLLEIYELNYNKYKTRSYSNNLSNTNKVIKFIFKNPMASPKPLCQGLQQFKFF